MNIEIKMAATDAERDAIYRLRYEIYVEEMQIFGAVADHERKMLIDPNDADARLMYAIVDGETVGTLRLNLGKDAPFSQEFEETYHFERFRAAATDAQMMAITRFMVKEKHRGSPISYHMIEECARIGQPIVFVRRAAQRVARNDRREGLGPGHLPADPCVGFG